MTETQNLADMDEIGDEFDKSETTLATGKINMSTLSNLAKCQFLPLDLLDNRFGVCLLEICRD